MATVLVVDPSSSVRETLRIVLGSEHDVSVCDALEHCPVASPPDVVVLGLPPAPRDDRALGLALARVASDAPVLVLHAVDDADVQALLPPHRRVDFLAKPFDAYALRARVRALL